MLILIMKTENTEINEKKCSFFIPDRAPEVLLIQPVDERGLEYIERQVAELEEKVKRQFILAVFGVKDWNAELSPWEAPPAFGDEGFGGRGEDTFTFLTEQLIPYIREQYDIKENLPMVIGGYSLAGLFSLWTVYKTDIFSACAAASPSVWFPKWKEFTEKQKIHTECVYLSLGDREEKTKNAVMSKVGDNIRSIAEMYRESGKVTTLEWNEGNHFKDAGMRTAKAFVWCVNCILEQNGS